MNQSLDTALKDGEEAVSNRTRALSRKSRTVYSINVSNSQPFNVGGGGPGSAPDDDKKTEKSNDGEGRRSVFQRSFHRESPNRESL